MSNKFYILVDNGWSGAKLATSTDGVMINYRGKFPINNFNDLLDVLKSISAGQEVTAIAISTAGFVNSSAGIVTLSSVSPFLEGKLVARLSDYFPSTKIILTNDGDAHARGLLTKNVKLGAINLAFGTSVALGVISSDGESVYACNGENWDIGDLILNTSAAQKAAYWALGRPGLEELEKSMGVDAYGHFGRRIGRLLNQLVLIFRPETVGLSGGIIDAHYPKMKRYIEGEFKQKVFLHTEIVAQDHLSAFRGLLTLLDRPD